MDFVYFLLKFLLVVVVVGYPKQIHEKGKSSEASLDIFEKFLRGFQVKIQYKLINSYFLVIFVSVTFSPSIRLVILSLLRS